MKKAYFPLCIATLLLAVIVFIGRRSDPAALERSADERAGGRAIRASERGAPVHPQDADAIREDPPVDPVTQAVEAETKPRTVLYASQQSGLRRALPIDRSFVTRLAEGPDETSIALPDGRTAVVVIERRFFDDKGNADGVEGRVIKPDEGRFLFRLQPAGDVAGPVTGHILLQSGASSYRVMKDEKGGSVLSDLPKDEVICLMPPPTDAQLAAEEIPAEHPSNIPIPAYQNGVIPLQSQPGVIGVIYLDFDGEPGPHEGWGDFDASPSGATNTQVREVWARVAEDFAPFKLNVTTDLAVFLAAPKNSRQRCIITPTKNAAPTAGGVAFLGSFNSNGDSPCWGFYSTGKSAAEVISHEIGHTLGLSHDGRNVPDEDYYGGHGSGATGWAPIMGVGYSQNLTQWSKGEYTSANQLQNDLNIIVGNNNNVAYRTDDAGPAHTTAAELEIFGSGTVDDEGTISHYTDVDAFRFKTTGGALDLTISPVASGPNLDISAAIHDADGNQLLVSNPDLALNATLSLNLPAGEYTVRVEGVGRGDPLTTGYSDYGSLGQYTIAGTIAGAVGPYRYAIGENPASGATVATPAPRNNHGASALTWAITAGNTNSAFTIDPSTGAITVANPSVLDYEGLAGNWTAPPTFNLTVSVTDASNSELNESLPVVITINDVNEAPAISGAPVIALSRTVPGTVLGKITAIDPDVFDYVSFSITSGNAEGKFAITPAGEIIAAGSWDVMASSYTLGIRGSDQGTPALTSDITVQVTVLPVASTYTPGVVYRTFYDGITGSGITALTSSASFPNAASRDIRITDFTDNTRGDNYGSTIRAWLIAPVTGSYRFSISGDDSTELRFSAAGNPAATTAIASRTTATGYQNFTTAASQQSSAIALTAGQVCYIESRQKEVTGGDHVSVGWEIKNSAATTVIQELQVIPGRYLSAHKMNYAPRVTSAESVIYRNAYQGATAARPVSADVDAGDTATFAITGGNAGNLFAIDAATGRIHVANATGLAASSATTIPITVTATDNGTPSLSGSGTITMRLRAPDFITTAGFVQEFWDNVTGTAVSSLTGLARYQADRPDRVTQLTTFNSGENVGNNYGARIRVLVTPPTTGSYKFYIASDDSSSLRLSTDATPQNAAQIASVSGSTGYKNWTAQTSQTSAEVALTAGTKYFLEALVKEGSGGDHLTVAWTGPGIETITILGDAETEPYDSNKAPDFAAASYAFSAVQDAYEGELVGTVAATDSPFEEICYGIVSGNTGGAFRIDPQTGVIRVASTSGLASGTTYQLQVGAQDSGHGRNFALRAALVPVSVTVTGPDQPPLFAQPGNMGSYPAGKELAIDLNNFVSDPGDPLQFSLVSGPAWGSLSSSGLLSGNPTIAHFGEHVLTVSVSDTHAHTVQGTLRLTVGGSSPVVASTIPLTAATGTMITGTVNSGSASDAATANSASFILREANSGVSPDQLSLLEYQWVFTVPADHLATLRVKAHHSSNTEGDDFRFTVSTDGGATFQNAVLVTTTTYTSLVQTYAFNTGTTGQVIVKVVDTDRTPGRSALHNLAIDMMALDLGANATPTLTDATFNTVPHAAIGTLLGTVQGVAGDSGQTLSFSITRGNEGGLFAIDGTGKLTVAGDIQASPSSHTLIIAGTDSGSPPLSNYAVVTVNVENSLVVVETDTVEWSSGTHVHQSLVNHGVLRLAGSAVLDVSGAFTNHGVLDLINWNGTLPAGFVNNGIVIDRTSVKTLSPAKSGSTFQFTVRAYPGHIYQLKTATSLSGPWVDSGSAVPGAGTMEAPQEIPFSAPAAENSRFYRIEITPAF